MVRIYGSMSVASILGLFFCKVVHIFGILLRLTTKVTVNTLTIFINFSPKLDITKNRPTRITFFYRSRQLSRAMRVSDSEPVTIELLLRSDLIFKAHPRHPGTYNCI